MCVLFVCEVASLGVGRLYVERFYDMVCRIGRVCWRVEVVYGCWRALGGVVLCRRVELVSVHITATLHNTSTLTHPSTLLHLGVKGGGGA